MLRQLLFLVIQASLSFSYTLHSTLLSRRNAIYLTTAASASLLLPSNSSQQSVCVIGASGETGTECVKILASEQQYVKAVSRKTPQISDQTLQKYIKNINADIKDPAVIDKFIKDTSSVIFLANAKKYNRYKISQEASQSYEDIDVTALSNIVHSCINNNVKRFVYVSASCRSCLANRDLDVDKMCGVECSNCRSKQLGEKIIRKAYSKAPGLDYTIIRIGFLINGIFNGDARGVKELEINQDYSKSGMISKYDLASLCINAAKDPSAASTTFEAYYRDTAQPYDIQESLEKCTSMGKSMEECFFGSEYKNRRPKSLEEVQRTPTKGSIFTTGAEISAETWGELFAPLKADAKAI
jgi:nucleoside-diphosphate-sugar epimerase